DSWPINGGEANDIFADEMQIRGPHAARFVIRAAYCAQISGERVKPHVKYMGFFPRNGNTPANCGARNAEILQAAFHEGDNFVLPAFGLNEIGVFLVEVEKRLLKRGQPEEVVFLRNGFRGSPAVGTVV